MVLNRLTQLAVHKPLLAASLPARVTNRFSSSTKKKGFSPMSLVNILGLPALAFIFFYILPVVSLDEMHNAEWNAEYFRELQKKVRAERLEREAALAKKQ